MTESSGSKESLSNDLDNNNVPKLSGMQLSDNSHNDTTESPLPVQNKIDVASTEPSSSVYEHLNSAIATSKTEVPSSESTKTDLQDFKINNTTEGGLSASNNSDSMFPVSEPSETAFGSPSHTATAEENSADAPKASNNDVDVSKSSGSDIDMSKPPETMFGVPNSTSTRPKTSCSFGIQSSEASADGNSSVTPTESTSDNCEAKKSAIDMFKPSRTLSGISSSIDTAPMSSLSIGIPSSGTCTGDGLIVSSANATESDSNVSKASGNGVDNSKPNESNSTGAAPKISFSFGIPSSEATTSSEIKIGSGTTANENYPNLSKASESVSGVSESSGTDFVASNSTGATPKTSFSFGIPSFEASAAIESGLTVSNINASLNSVSKHSGTGFGVPNSTGASPKTSFSFGIPSFVAAAATENGPTASNTNTSLNSVPKSIGTGFGVPNSTGATPKTNFSFGIPNVETSNGTKSGLNTYATNDNLNSVPKPSGTGFGVPNSIGATPKTNFSFGIPNVETSNGTKSGLNTYATNDNLNSVPKPSGTGFGVPNSIGATPKTSFSFGIPNVETSNDTKSGLNTSTTNDNLNSVSNHNGTGFGVPNSTGATPKTSFSFGIPSFEAAAATESVPTASNTNTSFNSVFKPSGTRFNVPNSTGTTPKTSFSFGTPSSIRFTNNLSATAPGSAHASNTDSVNSGFKPCVSNSTGAIPKFSFGVPSSDASSTGFKFGLNSDPNTSKSSGNDFGVSKPSGSAFGVTNSSGFTCNTGISFGAPVIQASNTNKNSSTASKTNVVRTARRISRPNSSGSGIFGDSRQPSTAGWTGTGLARYKPIMERDVIVKYGTSQTINCKICVISVMKEYESKSLDELRYEDYMAGRKGRSSHRCQFCPENAFCVFDRNFASSQLASTFSDASESSSRTTATSKTSDGLFGASQHNSGFSAPKTNTSSFGAHTSSETSFGSPSTSKSLFGAPNNSTGNSAPSNSKSIFGSPNIGNSAPSTSINTFGAPNTCNSAPSNSKSIFGAPNTGNSAPSTSMNTFGAPNTGNSAPSNSKSIFGSPNIGNSAPSTSMNTFGAPNTGNSAPSNSKSIFGSPTTGNSASNTSMNTFGAPNTSMNTFGAPSTGNSAPSTNKSIFGAPTTGSSVPSTSINTFGAPNTSKNTFGAPNTSINTFGAPNIGNSAPNTSKNTFGAPNIGNSAPNTSKNTFGAPNIGNSAPNTSMNTFGAPNIGNSAPSTSMNTFGATNIGNSAPSTSNSIFGAPTDSKTLFSANSSKSPFGAPSTSNNNTFGTPSTGNRTFGSPFTGFPKTGSSLGNSFLFDLQSNQSGPTLMGNSAAASDSNGNAGVSSTSIHNRLNPTGLTDTKKTFGFGFGSPQPAPNTTDRTDGNSNSRRNANMTGFSEGIIGQSYASGSRHVISNSGHGVSNTSGSGLGVSNTSGSRLGVSNTSGGGLGVSNTSGSGLGVSNTSGSGSGVSNTSGGGLGVSNTSGGGLGVSNTSGSGLGVSNTSGSGLGVSNTSGGGLGVSNTSGSRLEAAITSGNAPDTSEANTYSSRTLLPSTSQPNTSASDSPPGPSTILGCPNIPAIFISRWEDILKNGLESASKDRLLSEYDPIESIQLLKTPIVNSEIANHELFPNGAKDIDEDLQYIQDQLGSSIVAIINAINSLLSDENIPQIIRNLYNASRLLTNLHYAKTKERVNNILPLLKEPVADVLKKTIRDEMIFGSNMAEKVDVANMFKEVEEESLVQERDSSEDVAVSEDHNDKVNATGLQQIEELTRTFQQFRCDFTSFKTDVMREISEIPEKIDGRMKQRSDSENSGSINSHGLFHGSTGSDSDNADLHASSENLRETDSPVPDHFQNGNYVVLKADIEWNGDRVVTNLEDISLWKIDGKLLLNKYFPVNHDGNIVHKRTLTYTGWDKKKYTDYYSVTEILDENPPSHIQDDSVCVVLNINEFIKVRDK